MTRAPRVARCLGGGSAARSRLGDGKTRGTPVLPSGDYVFSITWWLLSSFWLAAWPSWPWSTNRGETPLPRLTDSLFSTTRRLSPDRSFQLTGQSCARATIIPCGIQQVEARTQSWTGQLIVQPANPLIPCGLPLQLSLAGLDRLTDNNLTALFLNFRFCGWPSWPWADVSVTRAARVARCGSGFRGRIVLGMGKRAESRCQHRAIVCFQ